MIAKRKEFLQFIQNYITSDPEAAAYVAEYVQIGLRTALEQSNQRAADMETVIVALAAKRFEGADALVRERLVRWKGKTALDWDWLTDCEAKRKKGE